MRADRLVAALLILQGRSRITARELAEELEVSPRTARRDLEALAMAGVPIYPQVGRGGGWTLLGGASTDLTGLTSDEARALFLTIGTAPNVTPALRQAVRKLAQALPEPFAGDAERVADVTVVDPVQWGRVPGRLDDDRFLEPLQRAVLEERRIELGYRTPGRSAGTRLADPLGLVAKAGRWYLVAGTEAGQRTFRVGRVTSVEVLDESFERPADFDLSAAWRQILVDVGDRGRQMTATGVAERRMLGLLRYVVGDRLKIGPPRADGRHDVEILGPSAEVLAGELAGFVTGLDIEGPDELRAELARLGDLLVGRYRPGPGTARDPMSCE